MAEWELFEKKCTDFLNGKYGRYAKFEHKGGSDSTIPDIKVQTQTGEKFFIEAKCCPAQCGQFVLLPNIAKGIFEYSRSNAVAVNPYSKAIMEYMNSDFEGFKEAGTSGRDINMNSDIFAAWIVAAYRSKGVKLIITNDNVILPIEKFAEYFLVGAKYRVKRSGSSSVGKGNQPAVIDYIRSQPYEVTGQRSEKNKLFVTSRRFIHNTRFIVGGTEYMFSKRGVEYEVRKLSNTFHANVIFSINLKPGKHGLSETEIISALEKCTTK